MTQPWGPVPAPAPDELLSSFLVRCALRHGTSPTRFSSFHLPRIEVWTRDIDRSAGDHLLAQVATGASLTIEQAERMTLRSLQAPLKPGSSQPASTLALTTLGIHHRLRRGFGLRCCPVCVQAEPVFRRVWRVRCAVACLTHQLALIDACTRCDAPIVPHRQWLGGCRCHTCHQPFERSRPRPLSPFVLRWQSDMEAACNAGECEVQGRMVSIGAYLTGLGWLTRSLGGTERKDAIARLEVRVARAEALARWLSDWPEAWIVQMRAAGVTQRAFQDEGCPEWILPAISQLTPGRINGPRKVADMMEIEIARLSRTRPVGWRTRRAQLLIRGARQR